MYFDAHVHSHMSPDSQMDPALVIATLEQQGLGVIFTEHLDYVTPLEGRDPFALDAPQATYDFCADMEKYPRTYLPLKNETVLTGLEIGLTAAFLPLNRQTAENDALDYIIGSVHFVDGLDLTSDYFRKPDIDHYRRMLVYMREMVERCGFFDALGHIDYVSRYTPFPNTEVWYASYADEYDAVLRALIERDKVMEINTSRFGNAVRRDNLFQIFKRYHTLGGRFITIGSDAHSPDALGRHFNDALGMAREIGLKPVYFKKRRMYLCE